MGHPLEGPQWGQACMGILWRITWVLQVCSQTFPVPTLWGAYRCLQAGHILGMPMHYIQIMVHVVVRRVRQTEVHLFRPPRQAPILIKHQT